MLTSTLQIQLLQLIHLLAVFELLIFNELLVLIRKVIARFCSLSAILQIVVY